MNSLQAASASKNNSMQPGVGVTPIVTCTPYLNLLKSTLNTYEPVA